MEILEQGFPLGFVMFLVMLCPTSTSFIFLFKVFITSNNYWSSLVTFHSDSLLVIYNIQSIQNTALVRVPTKY